jgi:hypothetical protein
MDDRHPLRGFGMGLAATGHHKSIRESNGSGALICRKLEPFIYDLAKAAFLVLVGT